MTLLDKENQYLTLAILSSPLYFHITLLRGGNLPAKILNNSDNRSSFSNAVTSILRIPDLKWLWIIHVRYLKILFT